MCEYNRKTPTVAQVDGSVAIQPAVPAFSGRATDPDRRTSVPRPAVSAGGGGQVQRTWQRHKSRARTAGWLARWLAGWLESLASHPVTLCWCFCSLYSHTSYGPVIRSHSLSCYTYHFAATHLAATLSMTSYKCTIYYNLVASSVSHMSYSIAHIM